MSGASTPMESSSSGVVSCLQVWTKVRLQRDLENRMLVQIQEELGIKSRKASDGAVE
jgi:hypothetical protein